MKKTTFLKNTAVVALLAGSALLFSLNPIQLAFTSHGGPLNWVEGLHDEGVALSGTERPILMGGDDGTNLVNLLVDAGGRAQVDIIDGGGGSQTEDAIHASGDTGSFMLLLRDDTPVAASGPEGDYIAGSADAFGAQYVTVTDGAGAAVDPFVIADFNAAFGTAGAADAQVLSIQGIASMTPVIVDLAGNNDVVVTAGLLDANSPMTLVDTFVLFDGSAETQIATTNLGASKSITISGTGALKKICIIVSLGTPFAEDMSIIFFDADPSITIEDASLTLAQAQNVQVVVSLTAAGFRSNFATAMINCQDISEVFTSITHVVFASEGATTYDDEDIEMRLIYRRTS